MNRGNDSHAGLLDVLRDEQRVAAELARRLEQDAEPGEVVAMLEALALVDRRRSGWLDVFRSAASSSRLREEERSIRQFVLRALDCIGVPQTTGFLEDYLYATELVEAKSRGMGALRRDEYRAWDRLRDKPRVAYIVPCLDVDGRPVSRWMARSDWPLSRRMNVAHAEEIWSLERVTALWASFKESDGGSPVLFVPLIERYAAEALGEEPPVVPTDDERRLSELVVRVEERLSTLRPPVESEQARAAGAFASWDERSRFWGVGERAQR